MRSDEDVIQAIQRHGDTLRRLCLIHLKNYADTEDILQAVFLKYALRSAPFESADHERAWFIHVTRNACRDLLKSFFRRRTVSLETLLPAPAALPPEHSAVLDALLSLPQKYREVLYLHYYEGYSAPELSRLLGKNVNTVYTLLRRAKVQMGELLGGDGDAE